MLKVYHSTDMSDRGRFIRTGVLVSLISAVLYIWFGAGTLRAVSDDGLRVHFLDVGQGDAILIETPDDVRVLIDGGPDKVVLSELASIVPLFDTSIDMVIATHPDTDHIGGLSGVLEHYAIGTVLLTENEGESSAAEAFAEAVQLEDAAVVHARRGMRFLLGASTSMQVLFPETDASDMESNTSSIVVKVEYGDTSFLFTGDAPKNIEEYLVLVEGEHLQSDVLKVGHHGSRTSTSDLFLDEVAPAYAIISASAENSYGHPHVEVTDALFNAGVHTFSTAEEGTITLVSDGTVVERRE